MLSHGALAALGSLENAIARAEESDDTPIRFAAEAAMQALLRHCPFSLSAIDKSVWVVGQACAGGALANRRTASRPWSLAVAIAGIGLALFREADLKRRQMIGANGQDDVHPASPLDDSLISAINRASTERTMATLNMLADQGPEELREPWAAAIRTFQESERALRELAVNSRVPKRRAA